MNKFQFITSKTGLRQKSVENAVRLLEEDASIPFIARYRKEFTGNLDEVQVEEIAKYRVQYEELKKRKLSILKAISEQGALDPGLEQEIQSTIDPVLLEDLYLPYKKKRKTKAEVARGRGLEPLAKVLLDRGDREFEASAASFVNSELPSPEDAIAGAQHIVAEMINEDMEVRQRLRKIFRNSAGIKAQVVKKKEQEEAAQKFRNYFDWEERLRRIPSHRLLAIQRAEKEGFLKVKVVVDQQEVLEVIARKFLKPRKYPRQDFLKEAIEDAYKRLLKPALSNEVLSEAREKADGEAISVFAENLEQLLLAPPLGSKRILALDPGFKSGCKLVCLDENGDLKHNETIFPHPPQKELKQASKKLKSLVNAYGIEAIAIGNGTASRETEFFVKKVPFDRDVQVFVVNEAGASVYSASKLARAEFPDYDVTVRGAVSIGRRLADPLAELVKIEPKAIGVGQYQHDVDQARLKAALDRVVESCVNRIGVNVNTASAALLAYVSGIGPALAENLVQYRSASGKISSRGELIQVPRLGAKAFEQAAGFLRVKEADNPLDDSAVHPESYDLVERLAGDRNTNVRELIGNKKLLEQIDPAAYVTAEKGLPTLKLILAELEKPGLDPRKTAKVFEFDENIKRISDLKPGMKLPGIVNNITNFGCFVDVGIKESGLVHISKLANEYVSDVNSVVRLHQHVEVSVLEVDEARKRIQLSLID